MNNPFTNVQQQLDEVFKIIKIEPEIEQILRKPMREFVVEIPVVMDDGSTKVFTCFRIQHNDTLGPTKGGIRFHPEETIDTVRALATWMTWKTAIAGLPLGGAKGGVICDPKTLSESELEKICRGYVRALSNELGPKRDVPGPDVGTNGQTMAWMADEYAKIIGHDERGVVTGKPVELGGSLGRPDATGRGAIYVLQAAAADLNLDLAQATAAVQGFGNAGYNAAKLAQELSGIKIVAISDSKGGIYDANGLDIEKVSAHKKSTGSIQNFENAKNIFNEELLELPVDVLMPSALENVINIDNADKIQAKIILEVANGPVTPEADKILFNKNIIAIPDVLANAGGVIVSYFEMVQNADNKYWTEDDVHQKLQKQIVDAYKNVRESSLKHKTTLRNAALILAVEKVANKMQSL